MVLIVYAVVYTSFVAVGLAITKHDLPIILNRSVTRSNIYRCDKDKFLVVYEID